MICRQGVELVTGEADVGRCDVLLEMPVVSGAGGRQHIRALMQRPREPDLRLGNPSGAGEIGDGGIRLVAAPATAAGARYGVKDTYKVFQWIEYMWSNAN